MLRVLGLVSFRIFPTHMGGQKGVADFYRHLGEATAVTLAASHDNKDSGKLELHRILYPNKKIYLNIFKIGVLKKLVREKAVDILVAEHSYTGWLAWLLHRATGKPFIIHSHNIESKRFRHMKQWWWRLYQWYEGWIHRKAQHSFFISAEDRDHAVRHFHIPPGNCSVITYGVEERIINQDRLSLRRELGLDENKKIFLFNGTLDYQPNYDAVVLLVDTIEPLLRRRLNNYRIVITGNRAPRSLIELMQKNDAILYMGYVPDVDIFYQAADLFINPVSNDTGVKTKLIEAIANGCPAISTASGASGIRTDLCGDQLTIVPDNDWNSFVEKIITYKASSVRQTPQSFYDTYSWRAITTAAAQAMEEIKERSNSSHA
jgi:glycosyltransferase involved in cell wall biosynthesis